MNKLLVILGPTATGKTDLGILLAKKIDGEMVACDSRQVYKSLDIGTGKLPGSYEKLVKGYGFWEIDGVKVWMYDVADPRVQFSVKDYVDQAKKVIEDIIQRGKKPILVGGTGLYLKGLLEGFEGLEMGVDEELRKSLEELSIGELQKKLGDLSPTLLQSLNESDKNNKRRLIRKIEILHMYPYIGQKTKAADEFGASFEVLKIGLYAPRPFLFNKIDSRLDSRFSLGLVAEAKKLLEEGVSLERMRELGLEYGVLADFLEDKIKDEELVKKLKIKNHQYAKRQMVWFKREKGVKWFDVEEKDFSQKVERWVRDWYNLEAGN